MKSINALGIAFTVGMSMALGSVPEAYAATYTNHSGTICKNYNNTEAGWIDYFVYGTRSLGTSDTYVICPLVRSTTNSAGATAYVDIKHTTSATTWCALYSYNWEGTPLGATGASWTGIGIHEFGLTLGPNRSAFWSDYSVLCRIPRSGWGYIMGIDLVEN